MHGTLWSSKSQCGEALSHGRVHCGAVRVSVGRHSHMQGTLWSSKHTLPIVVNLLICCMQFPMSTYSQ